MENETQDNVVEMLRAMRDKKYEATKHMTREELREYNRQRYEKAKVWFESVPPNPDRFPWLHEK